MSPVSVTTGVLSGLAVIPETVADSILERVRMGNADLIVMTTHGRGPLSRIGLGSVADELIRRAGLPVLVVRPSAKASEVIPEPVLDDILIPLDGSALAEQDPGTRLSVGPADGSEAVPSCASSRPAPLLPRTSWACRRTRVASRDVPGSRIADMLRKQGLQASERGSSSPDTLPKPFLEESAAQGCNLIALATHGRGGLKRLLRGSVADKVIHAAAAPVLVYHPTNGKC